MNKQIADENLYVVKCTPMDPYVDGKAIGPVGYLVYEESFLKTRTYFNGDFAETAVNRAVWDISDDDYRIFHHYHTEFFKMVKKGEEFPYFPSVR